MTDDTAVVGGAAIPFRPPGETDVARLAEVAQKTVSRVINGEERVLGAARELVRNPDVTAVSVANDGMAIGVIGAFTELRLSVPEDVSVVGLDDNPSAAFFTPPLTTVAQEFDTTGRKRARTGWCGRSRPQARRDPCGRGGSRVW